MEPESKKPVAGMRKHRSDGAGPDRSGALVGDRPPEDNAGTEVELPLRAQLARTWRHGQRMLFREQPGRTALYMAMFLLSSLAMMIVPQLFGEITNTLHRTASTGANSSTEPRQFLIWLFVVWAALLLIVRPLINIAVKLSVVRLDNAVGLALGQRLFRTVLAKPLPFFHQRDIGSLTYLLRDMSIQAQMAIRQLTLDPILMLFSLVAGLALVIYNYLKISGGNTSLTSWLIVSGLLILGLAAPILVSRFAPGLQSASRDLRDRQAALAALLQGALQSPEEVQSFNAVPHFGDKHRNVLREVHRSVEQQTKAVEKVNYFNSVPSDLTQVLLVGAAIFIVFTTSGVEHIGSLVAILLLVPQLMRPIQGLSSVIVSLKSAWPSIEAVLDIIEDRPSGTGNSPEKPAAGYESEPILSADAEAPLLADTSAAPAISADGLHFKYGPNLPSVFAGASFTVPQNRISTIVARMGQGKTTLFRLLLRFYRPESGELKIADKLVKDIDPRTLRHDIALLSQFPAFTHDSVRENLRVAAPDASDEKLLETCRATGMLEILNQELAYSGLESAAKSSAVLDAPFASGTLLSGGQRRLFALTRCLLRNPAILLLDEPTTGLDNNEKADLIPVLREVCAGKTVVIVDHDTRWIHRFCDHFIVLENGRTEEFDSREEVLENSRLFAELFDQGDRERDL
jgi:ABC-type multidrug transport system fused ATPase/permease subunit